MRTTNSWLITLTVQNNLIELRIQNRKVRTRIKIMNRLMARYYRKRVEIKIFLSITETAKDLKCLRTFSHHNLHKLLLRYTIQTITQIYTRILKAMIKIQTKIYEFIFFCLFIFCNQSTSVKNIKRNIIRGTTNPLWFWCR